MLAAIRHATGYGLFTADEADGMVNRVYALTAEPIALLTTPGDDAEATSSELRPSPRPQQKLPVGETVSIRTSEVCSSPTPPTASSN
ncbi:hypothetical protein [Amycolatopsis sp. WQ 127309]|uniref:hypothetical protein n=1 Tax=Amycolatopsis sp. WQ 127309 TaxID=2932773 RepID=UPI001FF64D52|nr:hypothetical protein [Amycolatopsis sp. WQ 127309]UOZ03317.1 hypothetical protein MUY22_31220 [Amycolatopsis sp. WQ 127309]